MTKNVHEVLNKAAASAAGEETRRGTFHFVDGTQLTLEWPQQAPKGFLQFMAAMRKSLEAERLLVEVDGDLLVITMANVKYVELSPAPAKLPAGSLRGARRVD